MFPADLEVEGGSLPIGVRNGCPGQRLEEPLRDHGLRLQSQACGQRAHQEQLAHRRRASVRVDGRGLSSDQCGLTDPPIERGRGRAAEANAVIRCDAIRISGTLFLVEEHVGAA